MIVGRVVGSLAFVNLHLALGKLLRKYWAPDGRFPLVNAVMVAFWVSGCILNSFIGRHI